MTEILSFETFGKGPGLILLHGAGSTGPETWGTVLDSLSAEYTVVLPNLPGSGGTPLPPGALDINTIADQVVATAHEAGADEFAVAGASVGAAIAVKIAARHPERVRALAALVGFARPRATLRLTLELIASMVARDDDDLGKFLAAQFLSEQYLASLPPEAVRDVIQQFNGLLGHGASAQIELSLGIDISDDLSAVRAPTLIVSATGDRLVAPEQSAELADGIAGAKLVEVAGGHASLLEDSKGNQEALLTFLREVFATN